MLDPDFVLDEGSRERLVARFGGGVDAWCAALPEKVKLYCLRWHLELDKALSARREAGQMSSSSTYFSPSASATSARSLSSTPSSSANAPYSS